MLELLDTCRPAAARHDRGTAPYAYPMAEHLLLTFPETRATEPVIYRIVTDFDVIPNIRRAKIENHLGWMVIELDGEPDDIRKAKKYLQGQGIGVERAEGDIIEG